MKFGIDRLLSEPELQAALKGRRVALVAHPASMTHAAMTPEARAAAGIPEGLLRLSVGIEATDDLLADLAAALSRAEAVVAESKRRLADA